MVSPSAGARALEHIHAAARFDLVRDANWPRAGLRPLATTLTLFTVLTGLAAAFA
jgi:hypothetical protein